MSERGAQQLAAGGILDQHVVLLRRPVNTRAITHRYLQTFKRSTTASAQRYRYGCS